MDAVSVLIPLVSFLWVLDVTQVIQTSMLKEFPAKEAKALIGFEVGRMVLQRLPTVIPGGLINPLANVYLATSAYIALQKATRPKPGLAGAPQWIRDILADHSRFSLKRLDLARRLACPSFQSMLRNLLSILLSKHNFLSAAVCRCSSSSLCFVFSSTPF